MRIWAGLALVGVMTLSACSSDDQTTPTTTTALEAQVEGLPVERYNAALEEWDAAVAEWSALVKARDEAGMDEVVVDGQSYETYEEWAKANNKPLRFEDVLAKYR